MTRGGNKRPKSLDAHLVLVNSSSMSVSDVYRSRSFFQKKGFADILFLKKTETLDKTKKKKTCLICHAVLAVGPIAIIVVAGLHLICHVALAVGPIAIIVVGLRQVRGGCVGVRFAVCFIFCIYIDFIFK
jgi:hypothetical protein